MIVWNGMDLISLALCGVLLLISVVLIIIGMIQKKLQERRDKKNQEWWDKRERIENDSTRINT